MAFTSEYIKYLKDQGEVFIDEPMSNYTTYKTGGNADILIIPKNMKSISLIIKSAKESGAPLTVIGGGSNLIVSDKGIRGMVLRVADSDKVAGEINLNNEYIYADASIKKEEFIEFVIESGYEDVEFMAGIPGTIGGGIFMNAGTNLGTFTDILLKVEYIDLQGNFHTINADRVVSSYRGFNIEKDSIITGGYFSLKKSSIDKNINREKITAILDDRKLKHPLSYPSAGSVFKNPKGFSSWKLIDETGLKGKKIGGAMVSDLHTNFIINKNNATSSDILALIEFIKDAVFNKFNILLETEIKILGEF